MHSLYLNCARTTKYPAIVKVPMALPAILITTSTGPRFAKMTENYEKKLCVVVLCYFI